MTGRAYEGGAESVTVGASSTATGVSTPISISNLYLGLDLQLSGPILNGPCKLELRIPTTSIAARFDLAPAPGDPNHVDVNMVGSPTVTLTGVSYEFISGICDPSTFLIAATCAASCAPATFANRAVSPVRPAPARARR